MPFAPRPSAPQPPLVPRLCLGTHCPGGSASRAPSRPTPSAARLLKKLTRHAIAYVALFGCSLACPPNKNAAWGADPPEAKVPGDNWAFAPLSKAAPPAIENNPFCRTPIDGFVLAQLRERGLSPNPPADDLALVRRVSFDLAGLPPSPAEVETYLAAGDDAYEHLVDRLLAEPAYGERWARHWLDVVRFAESDGFEHDDDRPHAYHYRDFVIQALNSDMPFDQFARWQIAGDEYEPENPLAQIATGFLTAGVFISQTTEAEFERTRYDQLDDMLSTLGVTFLGLTVGCARCHDHKFDPISTEQYYALLSTFTTTVRAETELDLSALGSVASGETGKVKVQVGSEGLTPATVHAESRGYPYFYPQTYVLQRGDPALKGNVAAQDFLSPLMHHGRAASDWQEQPPPGCRTSYRRRALANWLTDVENGAGRLLARVIVNRLWQRHMGRGLVGTPNDFGQQGERPTHPELLDWLAAELIRGGWRLKPIHKLILMSGAFRQSSDFDEADAAIDPENRAYWRYNVRRLEAETIRDSLLAVGGLLDRTMYGPGSLDESMRRRSVYFTVKRSRIVPSMQVLDAPEPLTSAGSRPSTTTAPQALLLLNSRVVRSAAEGFAQRLAPQANESLSAAVDAAYRLALSRPPTHDEAARAVAVVEQDAAEYTAAGQAESRQTALANFCQLLFCANEFVYIP